MNASKTLPKTANPTREVQKPGAIRIRNQFLREMQLDELHSEILSTTYLINARTRSQHAASGAKALFLAAFDGGAEAPPFRSSYL